MPAEKHLLVELEDEDEEEYGIPEADDGKCYSYIIIFKRSINWFVEKPIIRRNKSSKAIDVSCSSDCKIAQKQCSESSKSKSELIECIKSTWDNPDISGTSDGGKSYF